MLDNSETNHTVTAVILLVVIAAIATMFFGLSDKTDKNVNCLAIGEELMDKGGRKGLSSSQYQVYRKKIKAACSKKVAQDFLTKAGG